MVSDGCLQSSHLSKYDSFHQHCCELWASATVVQKGVGSFLLTLLKSVLLQFVKNFILRIRAKFKVLIKVVFFDSFIILSKIRVSVSYLFHEIILIWNNTLPESFFFFPKCFLTSYNTELTMAKGSPFLSTILVGTLK